VPVPVPSYAFGGQVWPLTTTTAVP
jgi:hypothetical protein